LRKRWQLLLASAPDLPSHDVIAAPSADAVPAATVGGFQSALVAEPLIDGADHNSIRLGYDKHRWSLRMRARVA